MKLFGTVFGTALAQSYVWERVPNAAIPYWNVETLTGASVESCKEACDGYDWCNSFDYFKSGPYFENCDLSDAPLDTELKTDYAGNPLDHYRKVETTSRCAPSWSAHMVDGVVKCYKNFGLHQLGQANSVCASSQASLLSPQNVNEFIDLKDVIGSMGFDTAALDGSDTDTEDTWVKSDGSPVPFFQWLSVPHQEPNNAGGDEDCLQIHVWEGSQDMNDRPCTFEDNTICEKPSVVCLNDAWEVDEDGNCQPKPTHFRLECSASGMVLQIDDVVFPDGEDITLEDSTCTGTKTGNIWSINTSLDSCQTSMVVETDSNGVETLAFSNTVKFNSFSAGAEIYTGNLVYIDFTCNYGSSYDNIEVTDVNVVSENVDADSQDVDGQFTFGLVQYTDSAMSDAADAGHTTPLGGTVYFQLTMDNPVSSLDWVITECVVVDDTLNLSYALINGQCPDTNLQVQTTNVGTPKSAINFSYIGFKFTQYTDNQQAAMKIRCSVTVCDASAATSTCNFDPATC